MRADTNFEDLQLLLKASSKELVVRICNEAFLHRNGIIVPESVLSNIEQSLGISQIESTKVFRSVCGLVKAAVFQGSTDPGSIVSLFPDDFHENLRNLLGKILIENLPNWRANAINNQVSLPRLVDFDWRVDIKMSADGVARMSVPTCILQMKFEETPLSVESVPQVSGVNVELSKETLDTMLDGLGKIRDQLSAVAKK